MPIGLISHKQQSAIIEITLAAHSVSNVNFRFPKNDLKSKNGPGL